MSQTAGNKIYKFQLCLMRFKTNHPWRMHTKNGSPKENEQKKKQKTTSKLKEKNKNKKTAKKKFVYNNETCRRIHWLHTQHTRQGCSALCTIFGRIHAKVARQNFQCVFSVGSFIKNKPKKKPKFVDYFQTTSQLSKVFFFSISVLVSFLMSIS